MSRRSTVTHSLGLALAVLCASLSPSLATARMPAAATHRQVADAIEAARRGGASQAEVDSMLADRFGWISVSARDRSAYRVGAADSENQDVDMLTPNVYYNTQQGRYEAYAWFHWRMCGAQKCYLQDNGGGSNVGGYDGFGISIGKLVTRFTQSFYVYREDGTSTTYRNPWEADDSGATYRNQDKFTCGFGCGYNWDHGLIVYSFQLRHTCPKGNYSINTKLGHTWESTEVSNITVSTSGVSITFNSTQNRWQAVNPVQRNWYPCGS